MVAILVSNYWFYMKPKCAKILCSPIVCFHGGSVEMGGASIFVSFDSCVSGGS